MVLKASKGQFVDHINGNILDNRKQNLRFCTLSQNGMNRKKATNTSSRFKGVHFWTLGNCFKATITINRKNIHLGNFKTEIEAAIAYNSAAIELYGEFARINDLE